MESIYPSEPAQPHNHCNCQVTTAPARLGPTDRKGYGWFFQHGSMTSIRPNNGTSTFSLNGHLYVLCCDGVTIFDEPFILEVTIDQDINANGTSDEFVEHFNQQLAVAEQQAEARAAVLGAQCVPCGDPPLVS